MLEVKNDLNGYWIKYSKFDSMHEISIPKDEIKIELTQLLLKDELYAIKLMQNGNTLIKQYPNQIWSTIKMKELKEKLNF